MIESEYREMFSETVTLYPPQSMDAYGRVSYQNGIDVPAHTQMEKKLVRDQTGREVVQSGNLYLYGAYPSVTEDWLLLLGSGASATIIGIHTVHDENGPHHTVLSFGA